MLNGSTVKGSVPVSMAKVLTPLRGHHRKCSRWKEEELIALLTGVRWDGLHRPDVHFGSVLPVSQQLGGRVGGAAALGAEELRGQGLDLQSVAQPEVCTKYEKSSANQLLYEVCSPSEADEATYPRS